MINIPILALSTVIAYPIAYFLTNDKSIKKNIETMIRELKLYNSINQEINIKYTLEKNKIILKFDVSGILSSEVIEKNKMFIKELFKANELLISNNLGAIEIFLFIEELKNKRYEVIDLKATELLLGFGRKGLIIADMKIMPHLLISGLSGQGKTGLLRVLTSNLKSKADIFLCNAFDEDFKNITNLTFIKGPKETLEFLKEFKKNQFYYKSKPRYIIFEELMTLSDKKNQDLIKEFLCISRHYNIYIIGVIQVSRAEDFKAKTFFNSRLTFKQEDKSSYGVAVGTTKELDSLKKREFYFKGQDGIVKGKTFDFDF